MAKAAPIEVNVHMVPQPCAVPKGDGFLSAMKIGDDVIWRGKMLHPDEAKAKLQAVASWRRAMRALLTTYEVG